MLLITEALSFLVAHAGRSVWSFEQAQVKGRSREEGCSPCACHEGVSDLMHDWALDPLSRRILLRVGGKAQQGKEASLG